MVGNKVREVRRNYKPALSQKELAARLETNGWKISRGTLSKIEAGIRQVTDFELIALAEVLKVSPESLLDVNAYNKYFKDK